MPTRAAAFCIAQVSLGLTALHRKGIVYRNLRVSVSEPQLHTAVGSHLAIGHD